MTGHAYYLVIKELLQQFYQTVQGDRAVNVVQVSDDS